MGKLNVIDDLEKIDGQYYTPDDATDLNQLIEGNKNLDLIGIDSRETTQKREVRIK